MISFLSFASPSASIAAFATTFAPAFSINVSKSYLNYSWIEHTTPFLFSFVGLIASYLLKTDIECVLSFITDSQETKLTLTGLVMNEAASNKAKETNDRVDEVNREFSNLKPVNK